MFALWFMSTMKPEQRKREVEFKRISEDIRCMNSILKPLTDLDENTFDDFHAEVYNLDSEKNRLLHPNTRHEDHPDFKRTLMRKTAGPLGEELNGLGSLETAGEVVKPSQKPCTMVSSHNKAFYSKKENLESGSAWARATLSPSKVRIHHAVCPGPLMKVTLQSLYLLSMMLTCSPHVGMKQPKGRDDLPDSSDLRRLQEEIKVMNKVLKPLTRLENEVFEEISNAVYGPESRAIDAQPLSNPIEHKSFDWKNSDVPSQTVVGKSLHDSSQKRQSFEETGCCMPTEQAQKMADREGSIQTSSSMPMEQAQQMADQEDSIQTSSSMPTEQAQQMAEDQVQEVVEEISCDVWAQSPETVNAPLLSQYKTRSDEELSCGILLQRPELVKTSLLSHLETQSKAEAAAQRCEEIGTRNHDHMVVIFSVQKNPEGRVGRQKSSKLQSTCTRYSSKLFTWMTSLCREQDIKGCLRRMIPRSPRAFVELSSQNLPEFSTQMPPLSAEKKLAEEVELNAVLVKINEVFLSMERTTCADNVQVNQMHNRLNVDGA